MRDHSQYSVQTLKPDSSNTSRTFAFENRRNVGAIALSPDGHVLISVDTDGRALLASFQTGVVLAHINFKKPVRALRFSPCRRYLAVTHGSHVQVWRTPSVLVREFAPFVLHRTYTGHHADVTGIEWSPDSKCVKPIPSMVHVLTEE